MRVSSYWSLLALPVALAACSKLEPARPRTSVLPVYAADLQGGAKLCTVPPEVSVKEGQTADATMTIGNDGGWCGLQVSLSGPKPYDYGLLSRSDRPNHGEVNVHAVGDFTRVDYTPDRGYVGPDSFTVELRPGSGKVKIAVTVQGVAVPVAAPVAPAVAPTPARAPAAAAKPAARPAATRRAQ